MTSLIHDYRRSYQIFNHAVPQEDEWEAEFYADLCPSWARTVLDIGCAEGFLLAALSCRGFDAIGIDIDPRTPGAIQCDIEAGAIGGMFDVIYCNDVIEHFRNVPAALDHIRSMMHDRSVLIINTPNSAHFKRFLRCARGKPEVQITNLHLQAYDYYQLSQTLALCGLKVVEQVRRTDYLIDRMFPKLGGKLTVMCRKTQPYAVERMIA